MDRANRIDTTSLLREHGIQPSAQRVVVGDYIFYTDDHPSADQVWQKIRRTFPVISRATVYNTLNLFAEKGLIRRVTIAEDSVVFDGNTGSHHHFIDEETGQIHDVPWEKVQVCNIEKMRGYEIHDYQVVMRGKLRKKQS